MGLRQEMEAFMRIAAFEVRPDERAAFAREQERPGIEGIALHEGSIDKDLSALDGADAALVLGKCHYGEELLHEIADRGVHVLVTRTVGMDHIDLEAARKAGVACDHVSYAPDSVADFTLMLMLVVPRHYKAAIYRQNVNDYSLGGLMGRTLSSMKVGIVGTGQIGTAVAERLHGFGAEILAYGHHENGRVRELGTYVGLDELFAESDMISLHVPATPENHHMIDREALAKMKDGVILVNTARADLMDVEALTEGIESGKIGALAMDVFSGEQGIYHAARVNDIISNRDMAYLCQFPNTVLTQHMAFYTQQAVDEMVSHAVEAALRLQGSQLV